MKIEKIKNENKLLLEQFENHLKKSRLSQATIDKHTNNIDFYINEFLLYEGPQLPKEGVNQIDYFLGSWFIRKAMWASVNSVKENITSIKKFYQFMYESGEIEVEKLEQLKTEIKDNKDVWLKAIQDYDNPDIDIEDIW